MQDTANYQLKKYQGTDSVDLINGYNVSMDIIDSQMKSNADAASEAATTASTASTTANSALNTANTANTTANTASNDAASALSAANAKVGLVVADTDTTLTVAQLAEVKVSADGILYYKASS